MINETRRSGQERREKPVDITPDNRNGSERREALNDSERIIESMKKIPVFKGLTNEQYKKILRICSKKMVPKDHLICRKGDNSDALFLLTKGQLKVMLQANMLLTYIKPLGLVGEIGVFTGSKRTATVLAYIDSTVIKINKTELFSLFKNDCELSNYILLNVIEDLANKLQEDNDLIEDLRNKKRTRIL
ncbi:MAG: Crp/Fnr family transcriptional regulator [Candidatus Latescibacteria bacterium]|nr:Crp/Fnr family transcriptional regulator [Candidatus Latescibacterota bacterium]